MRLPRVREVTRDLANYKSQLMKDGVLRVHLYVGENDSWCCCGPWCRHHAEQPGSESYYGFLTYGILGRSTNCWRLARELIADVRQQIPVRSYTRRNR